MKKYSKEIKDFIKENVKGRTTKELIELVNAEFGTDFTESKMKSYKSNNKLKSGTLQGIRAGEPTKLYPVEIREFINSNYKGIGPKDMGELLNKKFKTNYTKNQIKNYYKTNKLNSGLDGRMKKGNIPWNKGKKGVVRGGIATQFKKGHLPQNRREIGEERVDSKDGYIYIKIQDGGRQKNWKTKHSIIWEKANGPIPEGYVVIFGDRDKRNFELDNLILISREQLLIMNSQNLIKEDIELTKTGVIISEIYSKINEKRRKKDE